MFSSLAVSSCPIIFYLGSGIAIGDFNFKWLPSIQLLYPLFNVNIFSPTDIILSINLKHLIFKIQGKPAHFIGVGGQGCQRFGKFVNCKHKNVQKLSITQKMSKSCQLHQKCPKVFNYTKNVQKLSITPKMSKCSYKIPTSHNPFQL